MIDQSNRRGGKASGGRGGKRPGAGRPRGSRERNSLEREAARELVRQRVTADLEPLLAAQLANAKGLSYLVTRNRKTGKFIRVVEVGARVAPNEEIVEVWEKDPNVQAFADLMNRALGKPAGQLPEAGEGVTKVMYLYRWKTAED